MSGVVGYLYQSAKDNIRWMELKPKDYIYSVMKIGSLVHLSEEDFLKTINHHNADTISDDDVRKFYENYRKNKKAKEK